MILPMNAKLCPPDKIESVLSDPQYIAEIKIDGYRCIFENGSFHSRLGHGFNLPMFTDILKDYNVTLDGELYIPGGTSSDVTTALGKDGDKSKLRYVLFDILKIHDEDLIDTSWGHRRNTLKSYYLTHTSLFGIIDISYVYPNKFGLRTLDDAMEYITSHNIEGFMLKNINALYFPDKRPEHIWYKVKKHKTADVVCIGYEQGKGKFAGQIGSIVFGLYKGKDLVRCGRCSGMTDEVRMNITLNQDEYLGRVFEVGFMERTKDGNFRHPAFKHWRTDKLPMQCSWIQD